MNKTIKKKLYNKIPLHINKKSTLFILDWDDTLYPTSWASKNEIDLTNPISRYKYVKVFENYDNCLAKALHAMLILGTVIIITNALPEWVELTQTVLPKTKTYIKYIEIISARKNYQHLAKFPEWKIKAFNALINQKINKNKNKYNNILSLGDAEYEYNALITLNKNPCITHTYLKSIKFIKSLNYDIMIEQLNMIYLNINVLTTMQRNLDLVFTSIKI